MEHLRAPHDAPVDEAEKVPYLCKYSWDNEPFLGFPRRCAKLHFLNTPRVSVSWQRPNEIVSDTTVTELEELYQLWLFFGLLREVLGDTFVAERVINVSPATFYIDTSVLPFLLDDWIATESAAPWRNASVDHIVNCLELAAAALRVVSLDGSPYSAFNKQLQDSIASTCEMVASAALILCKEGKEKHAKVYARTMQTWREFLKSEKTRTKMKFRGWCPFDIRKIFDTETSFSTIYYFSKMNKAFDTSHHAACEQYHCKRRQIAEQEYERFRKHIVPCQNCSEYSSDISKLENCLFAGSFPVLCITLRVDDQIESIEIVPASKCAYYVAVSHVWADGLGNPSKNSLYLCQISRLARMTRELKRQILERNAERDASLHFTGPCARWAARRGVQVSSAQGSGSHACPDPLRRQQLIPDYSTVYLWIDTLCCPVKRSEAKNLALRRMNNTYAGAGAVLVLDKEMQDVKTSSMDWLEMAARIVVSRWATRLWTLQEATFAADIWIQFRDKAIDLYDVWYTWPDREETSAGSYALKKILRREMLAIKLGEDIGYSSMSLAEIDMAVRNRSISKAADEAYCLGSLLDVDVSTIIGAASQESKMVDLWQRLSEKHGIPQTVIFHTGARLRASGFRWAPSSLLDVQQSSTVFQVERRTSRNVASGLPVSFSGFRFHVFCRLGGLSKVNEYLNGKRFWIRIENSRWLGILFEQKPHIVSTGLLWFQYLAAHPKSVACITFADGPDSISVPGVLGHLETLSSGQPIFRSAFLCKVIRIDEAYARTLDGARSIVEANLAKEPLRFLCEAERSYSPNEDIRLQLNQGWEKADEWFARQALEATQQFSNSTARTYDDYKTLIRELFTGINGQVVERYASDHRWLVD